MNAIEIIEEIATLHISWAGVKVIRFMQRAKLYLRIIYMLMLSKLIKLYRFFTEILRKPYVTLSHIVK